MLSFLVGLSGILAPGFAQGLMSRPRAMAIALGLCAPFILATQLAPWLAYGGLVVMAGAMLEAGLFHRRHRGAIRWSWGYPAVAFAGAIAIGLAASTLIVESFRNPSSAMYPTLEIGDHFYISKLTTRLRPPERGEIIVFRQPCQPRVDYVKRVIAVERDTVEVRCGVVYVNGAAVPSSLFRDKDRYVDRPEGMDRADAREVSRYRETIGDHAFDVFHDIELPARTEARRTGALGAAEGEPRDFPRDRPPSCAEDFALGMTAASDQRQELGTIVETDASPASACKPHRHYVVPEGHVFVMGDNRENSNDSRVWGSVPVGHVKGPIIGVWYPFGRIGRVQ